MASTINAKSTGVGGIDASGDSSGVLELQTGGTTAVTIDASQQISTTKDANINGVTVGLGSGNLNSNTVVGSNSYLGVNPKGVAEFGAITPGTGYTEGFDTYFNVQTTLLSGTPASVYPTVTYSRLFGVLTISITTTGSGFVDTTTVLTIPSALIGGTGSGLAIPISKLTGTHNTVVGSNNLIANTTGINNTVVGVFNLNANTTGTYNAVVGSNNLLANTTGNSNTVVGRNNLNVNTTGYTNTVVGSNNLLANTTGYTNTVVGPTNLYNNTTGAGNTVVGDFNLYANTTGNNNLAFGYSAGPQITTGSNHICIGNNTGGTQATGADGIYIGRQARASASANTSEIVIGSTSFTNTVGKGSNTGFISPNGGGVYQGNNSASWSVTSDQRLKKNIVDNIDGLNKINAIQVRNFEYRLPEEVTELEAHSAIDIKGTQLGAIAQELQVILPECVKTESTGVMSVDATNLTWYLINAVKELKAELDALKLKVGA